MGVFDNIKDAAQGGEGSMVDKAKDQVNAHEQQVDQGVERAGDMLDDKTGGKFAGQVDKGQSFVQDKTGNL